MERQVKCGECGSVIDEAPGTPPDERRPCPNCGSKTRTFELTAAATISATSSITGRVIRTPEPAIDPTVRLEEFGFKVTWLRSPDGLYLVEVRDDAGNLLDMGGGDDPEDCILGVAERLLRPAPDEE
ncbi:MAG TPA: hypothetical protein VE596_03155 [Gaiellaceae bacterium]|nr:hypothetical protein [Gaiellaceae bacterium]